MLPLVVSKKLLKDVNVCAILSYSRIKVSALSHYLKIVLSLCYRAPKIDGETCRRDSPAVVDH